MIFIYTPVPSSPLQVTVVPSEEWERIQASLSCADREAEQRKTQLEARKSLHKTSKTIVSNWENTIEVGRGWAELGVHTCTLGKPHGIPSGSLHVHAGPKAEETASKGTEGREGRGAHLLCDI